MHLELIRLDQSYDVKAKAMANYLVLQLPSGEEVRVEVGTEVFTTLLGLPAEPRASALHELPGSELEDEVLGRYDAVESRPPGPLEEEESTSLEEEEEDESFAYTEDGSTDDADDDIDDGDTYALADDTSDDSDDPDYTADEEQVVQGVLWEQVPDTIIPAAIKHILRVQGMPAQIPADKLNSLVSELSALVTTAAGPPALQGAVAPWRPHTGGVRRDEMGNPIVAQRRPAAQPASFEVVDEDGVAQL